MESVCQHGMSGRGWARVGDVRQLCRPPLWECLYGRGTARCGASPARRSFARPTSRRWPRGHIGAHHGRLWARACSLYMALRLSHLRATAGRLELCPQHTCRCSQRAKLSLLPASTIRPSFTRVSMSQVWIPSAEISLLVISLEGAPRL